MKRIKDETQDTASNIVEYSYGNTPKKRWIADTRKICISLLERLGISGWEVSVLFCDDATMQSLNKRYRKKDRPTDVLAFRQADHDGFPHNASSPMVAGDIVISVDTMLRNARRDNVDKEKELRRLLIHAILHLNGLDHTDDDKKMIVFQEKLLDEIENEGKR
jgi:probable rRNA maturation factor